MNKLHERVLGKLLSKACSGLIPRSGDSGKKVDCYSISLYEDRAPVLLVEDINSFGFVGRFFDGERFNYRASIPFKVSREWTIRIDHYHGLVTHTYSGVWEFIANEWSQIYRLKSIYTLSKHSLPQYFFNRKKLQLPERMKILEGVIAKQLDAPDTPFNSRDIMTYIYSLRWYLHPQSEKQKKNMDLYLKSFEASGELERSVDNSGYKITGKAVATLENYQIETARAKDAKKASRWMLVLTFLLAFFASFQSGLIKTEAWLDLTQIWK